MLVGVTGVLVGGLGVLVAGAGVFVGGRWVFVAVGSVVAVGWSVGGTLVAVTNSSAPQADKKKWN